MDPLSARAIFREAARRSGADIAKVLPPASPYRVPQLLDRKHAPQWAAFSDPSPKIAIDAGGRSGKTTGSIRWLIMGALESPRSVNVFIGLTREEAKLLAWDEIKDVNDLFGLGLTFNEANLMARAPNGAKIWVTGVDQKKHVRKLRGLKYRRIVLEECGAQGSHLKELVQDVLEPRTVDLNGQICMLGTPNAARAGFFFDAVHAVNGVKGWSHHHWTLFENPYMAHARKWVQEELFDKRGWTPEHPTYRREYLGEWVRDDSAMVYDFQPGRNTYKVLPEAEKWNCVLGMDIGWRDATAFVVWGWRKGDPNLYLLYAFKRSKITLTRIFKIVEKLRQSYRLRAIVVDPANAGRAIVEEANERWAKEAGGIKMEAAKKTEKKAHIELMNDDLNTGRVKILADSPLAEEWTLLQWDETGEDEDERFENHLADAALYGWRRAQHFRQKPPPEGPPKGSAEWERQLAREAARNLERKHKRKIKRPALEVDPLGSSTRFLRCCANTAWKRTKRRPTAHARSNLRSPRIYPSASRSRYTWNSRRAAEKSASKTSSRLRLVAA